MVLEQGIITVGVQHNSCSVLIVLVVLEQEKQSYHYSLLTERRMDDGSCNV